LSVANDELGRAKISRYRLEEQGRVKFYQAGSEGCGGARKK